MPLPPDLAPRRRDRRKTKPPAPRKRRPAPRQRLGRPLPPLDPKRGWGIGVA